MYVWPSADEPKARPGQNFINCHLDSKTRRFRRSFSKNYMNLLNVYTKCSILTTNGRNFSNILANEW